MTMFDNDDRSNTSSDNAPSFTFKDKVLALAGEWTATRLGNVPDALAAAVRDHDGAISLDLEQLGSIDTAGVFAVARVLPEDELVKVVTVGRDFDRMADLVRPALQYSRPEAPKPRFVNALFQSIGKGVVETANEAYRGQTFAGRLVLSIGRTIRHPRRLRATPLVAIMGQAGLSAIPIVALMTFFIGAVLALVGSNMLQTLGVKIYAVELVGIGILREFGAVVAAILFAGRSASAFAAQLGSMKMNQEIDAMSVMNIDRFEALVIPRVLAALVMLPLLTVVADVGGLVGGLLVSWTLLDIEPTLFLQRLVEAVGPQPFWVGMAKVPLFALAIATTGCRHGMSVGGDVQSLGDRVTRAVVQSIFLIIMFDALFAVLFERLDL